MEGPVSWWTAQSCDSFPPLSPPLRPVHSQVHIPRILMSKGSMNSQQGASVCMEFRGVVSCVLTQGPLVSQDAVASSETLGRVLRRRSLSSEVDTRTHDRSHSQVTWFCETVYLFLSCGKLRQREELFIRCRILMLVCAHPMPPLFLEQTRRVRDSNSGTSLPPFAVGSLPAGPGWVPPASLGC